MRITRLRSAALLATMALIVGAPAAFASTTLSVDGTTTPAGSVGFTASSGAAGSGSYLGPYQFESDYGVTGHCQQLDTEGTLLRGANNSLGSQIGSITAFQGTGCLFTDLDWPMNFYKKPGYPDWKIYLDETPSAAQPIVKVEIRGVSAQMNSTTVVGTWNCAIFLTGTIKGTLNTLTDQLIINTPTLVGAALQNPLTVDALPANGAIPNTTFVSCGAEFQDGDKISVTTTVQLDRDIAID